MKPFSVTVLLVLATIVGVVFGSYLGMERAKLAVLANPYSDQLLPAHQELTTARTKLQKGDTDVLAHIQKAEMHVKNAEEWARQFVGSKENR